MGDVWGGGTMRSGEDWDQSSMGHHVGGVTHAAALELHVGNPFANSAVGHWNGRKPKKESEELDTSRPVACASLLALIKFNAFI